MKNSIFGIVLALVMLGLAPSGTSAQSFKVGFADPEIIITYMPEYQTVQQQIAIEYRTSQEGLQALAEEFQERVERYQKQQPLLTLERQAEREGELAILQEEIQTSAANKDQELTIRQEKLMEPLLQKVQDAIDAIAKEKGLDIVIRSPALLYVNPDKIVNINVDIAKRLGIEIEEEDTTASN